MSTVQARRGDLWIDGGFPLFCGLATGRSLRIKAQISSTAAGPSFLPWIMIGGLTLLSMILIRFPAVMTGLVYLGFTNLRGVWLPQAGNPFLEGGVS